MNAIVPRPTASAGLIPTTVPEAMELARMMATCGMLPEAFRDKPGNALMIVEQSMRWGLSAYAVAQETSVIQGKTFYSGKILAAAMNNHPAMQGRLSYDYSGAGDERAVRVIGTLRGESEQREVEVKLRDARTQNKNWSTQPDQQLAYHGARVWGRRHLPEVLLGAYSPEEFAPEPEPEPKAVTSAVVRQSPPGSANVRQSPPGSANLRQAEPDGTRLEPTSLRDMRPKPVPSRAEVDRILGGDQIPALEEEDPSLMLDRPSPPPVDRAAEGVAALEAQIRAAATEDELHTIAGSPQVEKQRAYLAKHRPELDTLLADALGERYQQLVAARLEAEGQAAEAATA